MANEKLGVGIIGGGSIADLHLDAFSEGSQSIVKAICDLNLDRAKEKAAQRGVPFACSDYHDLLVREDVDAVVVCTWNHTHAQIAIAALEAGKHVFVEKPMTTTYQDALLVEEAVRRSGKSLQVGFVRRFDPNVITLLKSIEAGEMGQLYYAKASGLRRLGNPGGWFADKELSGGGPLIDSGIHLIDTCWYLMGRPKVASITGNTYFSLGNRGNIEHLSFYKAADYNKSANTVEDLANALICFENGASLFIDASYTLHTSANRTTIQIFGEKGGAEIEPEFKLVGERHGTMLNLSPQVNHSSFHAPSAFKNQAAHFSWCCLNGSTPIPSVRDGAEIMRILSAIYESAETRQEIQFDNREGDKIIDKVCL